MSASQQPVMNTMHTAEASATVTAACHGDMSLMLPALVMLKATCSKPHVLAANSMTESLSHVQPLYIILSTMLLTLPYLPTGEVGTTRLKHVHMLMTYTSVKPCSLAGAAQPGIGKSINTASGDKCNNA